MYDEIYIRGEDKVRFCKTRRNIYSRSESTGRFCKRGNNVDESVYNDDEILWSHGRRIVELSILAEGLSKCYLNNCDNRLDLRNIVKEERFGYASILWIKCECGWLNRVPTEKSHTIKDMGKHI